MKRGLDKMDRVIEHIKEIALKYRVDKIILFGSRARGDHSSVHEKDTDELMESIKRDGVIIYE